VSFPKPISAAAAAAMVMMLSTGPAMAEGYTGSWPVTVTHSQHSNGTYCLTLTDNGGYGWRHSGSASLVIGSQKFPYGSFQLIGHTLMATIQAQGYGQNAGLVFVADAGRGRIGIGAFEDVYGGSDFDSGALAFGTKGGC
jgi:hypothetical protein